MPTHAPQPLTAEFQQPVTGTLTVQLENGKNWPATAEDLAKFGLIERMEAYERFRTYLQRVLDNTTDVQTGGDLTSSKLNVVRRFVERAILYPESLGHPEYADNDLDIVRIERALRRAMERPNTEARS